MTISADNWPTRPRRIVGLMSGTALDGVDAALIEVEGSIPPRCWTLLAFHTRAYTAEEQARIADLLRPDIPLSTLLPADVWLGELFAEAALAAIAAAGLRPADIDAVASHGQTIWHIPPQGKTPGATLQIGDPNVIAERTGRCTVADFRRRDMAAGGQGAPLVPFADYLFFYALNRTVAVQNIGGIGNVTWLPRGSGVEELLAFDTGPGNMIIDAVVSRASQGRLRYDADGKIAATGTVDAVWLAELLQHPYYRQAPPKSTGREMFGAAYAQQVWRAGQRRKLAPADIIATVTALTAESIARAYRDFLLPRGPLEEVILGGGGSYNPTLRAMLAACLPGIPVGTHEDHGINGAAKEAIAFALLGHATLCGIPANVPAATGASHPVLLGTITPAGS